MPLIKFGPLISRRAIRRIFLMNDYPFSQQHCIKSLGNNRYLMYDNGNLSDIYTGGIKRSRAVEYELNLTNYTASKVWEFVHPDSLFTPSIGSVQRLENGHTLINFGNLQSANKGSIITEVDTNNEIVLELEFDLGENIYCANKANWNFQNGTLNTNTSIYLLDENKTPHVYPNPSISEINIDIQAFHEKFINVQLLNLNGTPIINKAYLISENQIEIRLKHDLPAGNYIIKYSSEFMTAYDKLVVID